MQREIEVKKITTIHDVGNIVYWYGKSLLTQRILQEASSNNVVTVPYLKHKLEHVEGYYGLNAIYRNLQRLVDSGLLEEVSTDEEVHRQYGYKLRVFRSRFNNLKEIVRYLSRRKKT